MPHISCTYTTVSLDYQDYFYCPECGLSSPHPPRAIFLAYYTIGYGFCPVCSEWFVIAGGDKLGVVEMDGGGKLRTKMFSEQERADREKDAQERRSKMKARKVKGKR
jgi:hypothetical protein